MDEQQVTQKDKYVTFKSGNEYFGLKIEYVDEIIICQDITAVPESPEYIKGLINLRGKIIPVVDVRIRFGQEPFTYDDRTCIIVIHVKDTTVGLIVEKIAEVVEIGEEDIIPTPTMNFGGHAEKVHNKYVYAVGKVGDVVKLLLDPDRLINDDEILALDQDAEDIDDREESDAEMQIADHHREESAIEDNADNQMYAEEPDAAQKAQEHAAKKTKGKTKGEVKDGAMK